MEIKLKSIEPDEGYFTATLKLNIMWEREYDREALLNAFGNLKCEGKVIARLELGPTNIKFRMRPSNRSIKDNGYEWINLTFIIKLDAKITNFINNTRKKDPKGDVLLTAEITLIYLLNNMDVAFIREYKAKDWLFNADQKKSIIESIGADKDDASFLLYSYPKSEFRQINSNLHLLSADIDYAYISVNHITEVLDINIKSSDWVNDFLPRLRMGEYEIIEIPRINETEELADIMSMLNTAKQKLYGDLDIGASLTSLRNSLRKFKEFVKEYGEFDKLFNDNPNISNLAKELQKMLYGAASRSQDSTTSHAGGVNVEGYEVESMILMAYSLYKLVVDRIKSNRGE